jgi:hypothetical protein
VTNLIPFPNKADKLFTDFLSDNSLNAFANFCNESEILAQVYAAIDYLPKSKYATWTYLPKTTAFLLSLNDQGLRLTSSLENGFSLESKDYSFKVDDNVIVEWLKQVSGEQDIDPSTLFQELLEQVAYTTNE